VLNAASGAQADAQVVTPGSYVTIWGTNLAGNSEPAARSVPLPTTLNGTQVFINSQPVSLIYAGANQINAVIPRGLQPGTSYPLVVANGLSTSSSIMLSVAAAQPVAPQTVYVPPPPRDPIDWGTVAARVFTARTLAWAGAVATVLGVVLLFVLAASRGWVTPPMRLGIGVLVSAGLLGVSLELDRRSWRADAILAAAGAGIAGLYATLWAAASLYGYVSAAGASGLAAAIAALAVVVAIRFGQEPLAVFGVSGAMLAPVLVGSGGGSHASHISAYAVLYAAVMLAATLPLYARFRWDRLVSAAWLIAGAENAALLLHSADHVGFGAPVVATAVVVGLFVCLLFLVELRRPIKGITPFGWLVAASSFTLSLGGTFLFAGSRLVDGHSLAGIALLGVAAGWAVMAAVPYAVRRRHDDLTDVLAAFSLTLVASATGLLLGGAALPSTWAAQSALLVAAADRIARRSSTRQLRLTIAAGVYLTLAVISGAAVVAPTPEHLPELGAGSWQGSLAIMAVAAAGIVYCYGVRWVADQGRAVAWLVPGFALGYLPLWSLDGTWSTVALAAMAAALLAYRRSAWMISWFEDVAAIAIGCGWWLTGLVVAMTVAAPLDDLTQAAIDRQLAAAQPLLDPGVSRDAPVSERVAALVSARVKLHEATTPGARAARACAHRNPVVEMQVHESRGDWKTLDGYYCDLLARTSEPKITSSMGMRVETPIYRPALRNASCSSSLA